MGKGVLAMDWNTLRDDWALTVRIAKSLWPEVDSGALAEARDNPQRIVEHLAARHDLTSSEALEVVETWLLPAVQHSYSVAAA